MSLLLGIGLIAAAYLVGRFHQFVRDARSVIGTDRKKHKQ